MPLVRYTQQRASFVSELTLEMIQQMASEMNKSKRQYFLKLSLLTRIAEILWQVISYNKMFEVGSLPLIHGKIKT
jgi:hypothetical protein